MLWKMPKREVWLIGVVALLLASCGGGDESSSTDGTAANATGSEVAPSDSAETLTAEERAIVCDSFLPIRDILETAALFQFADHFADAATELDALATTSDAGQRLAVDMAEAGAAIEQHASEVESAVASLDFEPVNYMYTGHDQLFVDDGDPSTLTGLDVSSDLIDEMGSASESVLESAAGACGDSASAPSAGDS